MSDKRTKAGRPYIECDERTEDGERCKRRAYAPHGATGDKVSLFDYPRGWAVAPYSDDFDHGVTRVWAGVVTQPPAHLVGVVGSLHTCRRHRGVSAR